ncbi:MAG: hypothetical protein OIF57_14040 [Marinobacterium sp.]|nr:hypothetical protein [Marinobacterium sp.]
MIYLTTVCAGVVATRHAKIVVKFASINRFTAPRVGHLSYSWV